jgi:hypothetical protein
VISEHISILATPSNSGTNKASTNSGFDFHFDFDSLPPTHPPTHPTVILEVLIANPNLSGFLLF